MTTSRKVASTSASAAAAGATSKAACAVNAAITLKDTTSKTNVLRWIFIGSMAVAAVVGGSIAFVVARNLENELAAQTFESVADSAINGARAIARRKVQAALILASYHAHAFANASQWPFVALPGFMDTARQLDYISNSLAFTVNMIVTPNQVSEFEAFAEQTYADHGYPDNSGRSDFGFGIWARSGAAAADSDSSVDNRTHDTSGNTSLYANKHGILVPVFQISNTSISSALMFNLVSEPSRASAIGSTLDCAAAADPNTNVRPYCGVISEFTELISHPGEQAAILYLPIFPVNDPTTAVGLISTSFLWQEVLTNVVPDNVNGLVCVISTNQHSHTYVIRNGVPVWVGQGDLHDRAFDAQGKQVVLNDIEISTLGSTIYTVTVYPSRLMFGEFHTNNPMHIALGFAAVMLFSASLFFLYDFFMRHQARQRKAILDVKRRFVRFVSHEIRTPLNTVCLGLELLQAEMSVLSKGANGTDTRDLALKDALTSPWMHMVEDILENASSAVAVLNDLLHYDKIEQGTFSLDIGTVDIMALLQSTVSAFRIQAEKRNVVLDLVLAEAEPHETSESADAAAATRRSNVYGDGMRLQQVLRNLISNALKFSPEHAGVIHVKAFYKIDGLPKAAAPKVHIMQRVATAELDCVHPRAGSIAIVVQDNGVGMTQEQLGQLFQEGVQFDANKHQGGGGSGFGLHISKSLIEQHGGTIAMSSAGPGLGSTVTVELPLYILPQVERSSAAQADAKVAVTDRPRFGSLSEPSRRNHHVLVVDDAVSNRKMLVRLLERSGHTCISACNGQEAINAYNLSMAALASDKAQAPIDTILMDYEMPVMNGPDATRVLRENGCAALILGVTGNVLSEDIAYFKQMGADNVLAKPFQLAPLYEYWERV